VVAVGVVEVEVAFISAGSSAERSKDVSGPARTRNRKEIAWKILAIIIWL
jgi:hypothetical protein